MHNSTWRMPPRKRRSEMRSEFCEPCDENFQSSVSQYAMHQESLCKVSDYEISPNSKCNLPEVCCCDSRGRAIYWLYRHNLADGECVRQVMSSNTHNSCDAGTNFPLDEECRFNKQKKFTNHQNFRKQFIKLTDMFVNEQNSDIRITETHNSYINLGDIETLHILLSEQNVCRDKYHNLMMNLEMKQELLEDMRKDQIKTSNSKDFTNKLDKLFSIHSLYESNILSAGGIEMNDLDHILNQLNFFIKSNKLNNISKSQKEQLAKYLKVISEEYVENHQRDKFKTNQKLNNDHKFESSKPSVLELKRMPFVDSASEVDVDSFNTNNSKKNQASNTVLERKMSHHRYKKARVGSVGSLVDKRRKSFEKLGAAKKCFSTEMKKSPEKEINKKERDKSRSTRRSKSEKKRTDEEKDKGQTRKSNLERIQHLLEEHELERLKSQEREKEIEILKELLKEKERRIAEEDVKEKQIIKELLRERQKRKAEEHEERIILKEILKEREKYKLEEIEIERQRLKNLIKEKDEIILEEKLKEKSRRRRREEKKKDVDKDEKKIEKELKRSNEKEIKKTKSVEKIKKKGSKNNLKDDDKENSNDKDNNKKEEIHEINKNNKNKIKVESRKRKSHHKDNDKDDYKDDNKDDYKDNNNDDNKDDYKVGNKDGNKNEYKDNHKNQEKDKHKVPKYATCLTIPTDCSKTKIFKDFESLEQIPEEETLRDAYEDNKSKRKVLKINRSLTAFHSLIEIVENDSKKKNNAKFKETSTMVDYNLGKSEIGITAKPPQLNQFTFPIEHSDLFTNINEDSRRLMEKGVQIPSDKEKSIFSQFVDNTFSDQNFVNHQCLSKCSLFYESPSKNKLNLPNLYNTPITPDTVNDELGTDDIRSLPTTSCYSNHAVSIQDSLLRLDDLDESLLDESPKISQDNLLELDEKVDELDQDVNKNDEKDISDILNYCNNGIPIYKDGYEIARITNQTSSCFSTFKRYARANNKATKATQMFEHVTPNDLYTLKWVHDNLFEVDINPHTLILDEKIKELSEMSDVS
ncbi:uncharacterized protein DDB_G0283697-like [Onthophagus taurus]|uniref:uncharacterized protein DDB_G0283697-like n=1 Tax=Onthophagus taurus TaxID=166361 RepID=UPI0039BE4373